MNELAAGLEEARVELNLAAGEFLPDLCDLVQTTLEDDGHNGQTPKQTTVATSVPVRYTEVAGTGNETVIGSKTYVATHRLTFGASADTMAIDPDYFIRVHARGDKPEMMFDQPVRAKGSMAVFVNCLARFTVTFVPTGADLVADDSELLTSESGQQLTA